MFAFALWDSKKKNLLLARDHLGVKPLYYVQLKDRLLFASEVKSLLQDPSCPREVDLNGLGQLFTFRYVPSPNTIFKDIKKLPPAHWMLFKNGSPFEIRKYWSWKPQIINNQNKNELIKHYQYLLEDAVKLQLRSDVPIGLFLSSGIDSGTILAIMNRYVTSPIYTFTIGFEEGERTNETDDARTMANRFGTNHSEMIVRSEDYEKYYEHYLWDLEEPVGNETAAAFNFVSKIASEKVKVVLTGQGADEPWAGYHRHIGVKLSTLYSKFPSTFTALARKIIHKLPKNERLKRGVNSLDEQDILTRFTKIYSFYSSSMKDKLFQDWVKHQMIFNGYEPKEALKHLQLDVKDLDPLSQMLYIDTRADLPDDLLMVNDKTSMAHSIEARVPFLDYRLIEFIETIPSHLKLKGLQGKYLHKKAIEKWLPKDVIYRQKKGFANPIDNWLRGKMRYYIGDCLLSKQSAVNKYFNREYIEKIVKQHTERKEDYLRQIYLLISFELWHRQFIGN
jgi:asparagine synthase (glutamine-hydrolysing)